jgi:hypothetical protein
MRQAVFDALSAAKAATGAFQQLCWPAAYTLGLYVHDLTHDMCGCIVAMAACVRVRVQGGGRGGGVSVPQRCWVIAPAVANQVLT